MADMKKVYNDLIIINLYSIIPLKKALTCSRKCTRLNPTYQIRMKLHECKLFILSIAARWEVAISSSWVVEELGEGIKQNFLKRMWHWKIGFLQY